MSDGGSGSAAAGDEGVIAVRNAIACRPRARSTASRRFIRRWNRSATWVAAGTASLTAGA
jgi:hypothetical protein